MEGFSAEVQIVISVFAVVAAVLGFGMGHLVRYVETDSNKGAPAVLCWMGGLAGVASVFGLVTIGRPIICGELFVSSLVIGVGMGFMTDRRGS